MVLEIRERPPSILRNINAEPMGGDAGDSGAPTMNAEKMLTASPLGGGVRDLGPPTINAKKR
jgi:hypothetical protein